MILDSINFTEFPSHISTTPLSMSTPPFTSNDKRKPSSETQTTDFPHPYKKEKVEPLYTKTKNTRCYRHSSSNYASEFNKNNLILSQKLQNFSREEQCKIAAIWDSFSSSSADCRLLMLEGLVNLSCVRQLSYLNQEVKKQLRVDFMASASPEIGFKILSFLDAKSLCQAARVSKTWAKLANEDLLWHRMCVQHIDKVCHKCGWGLPLLNRNNRKKPIKANFASSDSTENNLSCSPNQNQVAIDQDYLYLQNTCSPRVFTTEYSCNPDDANCLTLNHTDSSNYQPEQDDNTKLSCFHGESVKNNQKKSWKKVFAERQIVAKNWKLLRYNTTVMNGDDSEVLCQSSNDTYIISAQKSGRISVFNSSSGTFLYSITHSTHPVTSLALNDCIFISGSLDGSIKVWCYGEGRLIRSITPFQNQGVTALKSQDKKLATGCINGNISIFDFDKGRMYTLEGHTDKINQLIFLGDDYLFSCSDDSTIRRWVLSEKKCTHIYNGHSHIIRGISLNISSFLSTDSKPSNNNHKLFSGSLDGTIRVWDIDSGKCLSVLCYHGEPIWTLASDSFRLLSTHNNGKICIWDSESHQLLHVLHTSNTVINSISLSDSSFKFGDSSGRIIKYSFNSQNDF
ncbi:hypothetical protein BB561_006735 [Smittium simulii]|uniref:F-box domain-containing protein n=1 Tax=Smittium simulii TaxID=133385 RepID=A0A2T9Y202_9FUNG|nr:hypothetical protein BB561_006735 [Smittium simulii]